MQTKKLFAAAVLVILVIAAAMIAVRPAPPDASSEKIVAAATIFPLADMAREIGGERVRVISIVPPGASPHTFEIKPSEIAKLQAVRIIFSVGHGLDDWSLALVDALGPVEIAPVDGNINLQGADPHYWLDPQNAKIIAENIAAALARLDPEGAEIYSAKLATYKDLLDRLHGELLARLENLPTKKFIVFHDSWAYFAEAFGLQIVGVFEPAPGREPSPNYLAALYRAAREHGVGTVFTEPQLASGAVLPFVQDLGLEVGTLDPLGGVPGRDSYIKLLRFNAEQIYNALQ